MYGAIFGDIIGSRFEFDRGGKTKDFELFTKEDSFTDDTVMTVAVAEGVLAVGPYASVEEIKREVIDKMKKWGRKYPYAGYGGNFSGWLFDTEESRPYGSYGNGSAMRVSAVGWLYDSLERTREVARATAEVTHNHPEGIKGAECTAAVIYMARTGCSKKEIQEYVISEFEYDFSDSLEKMRKRHRHVESCQDSLPKALRSFFDGDSYEDVVRNAVSLGGDTDTLAAIAGAMAEAFYGIPLTIYAEGKTYLPEDVLAILALFDRVMDEIKEANSDRHEYDNNQKIKDAVLAVCEHMDAEHYSDLLVEITERIVDEGEALTPIVDLNQVLDEIDPEALKIGDRINTKQNLRFSIDTMQDKEGKLWVPLFTDEEELNRQPTTNVRMNLSILCLVKEAFYNEKVEGLVINPFGLSFTVPKDALEAILEGYEEEQQKQSERSEQ